QVSGGVSNLSFAFRGNNAVREAIHAVFLYHAIAAGMNMGIVNPSLLQVYSEIEPTLLALTEDLVLNRRPDATERLLDYAQGLGLEKAKAETAPQWRNAAVAQRIKYAMIKGDARYIATDTLEAYHQLGSAMAVIDGPLMAAMTEVGELFGSGRMFLPQVVKTARVMKEAVAALEPYMDQQKQQGSSKGTVVLATVKGDVHDIGKNIVGVVRACNGYKVIDLGVMVPAQAIADAVRANNADVLGLSGLITPSLDEMVNVVQTLKQQGINVPVQIGGATTSELHTALKIAPAHSGPVVYGKDASQASSIIANLLSPSRRHEYMDSIAARYEHLRTLYHNAEYRMVPIEQARSNPMRIDWSLYTPTPPQCPQVLTFECYPIAQIAPHIDWTMLLYAWDIPGRYPEVLQHPQKGPEARKLIAEAKELLSLIERQGLLRASAAVGIFPAASRADDILIYADATRTSVRTRIPMLRSQQAGLEANPCLADFIAPEQLGLADWMGCFALTTGVGAEELSQRYRDQHDDFKAIMVKILADRLADAFAEHLHQLVRTQFWGYCPDTVRQGIRPAPGYPSCPDHRGKRIIFDLIDAEKRLGMGLTQSMAMTPNASVAGFYFAHPQAHYFSVGRIDTDQLADYAQRLGISPEEATRLMKIS
ncbi:MAG: B12-binding domain-containing protein, partial [Bacteroidales bacterium]|nr:B12-binding domain-containing protein [Bacteroidales bacterium]